MQLIKPHVPQKMALGLFLALALLVPPSGAGGAGPAMAGDSLSDVLRQRLEFAGVPVELALEGDRILATRALSEFYVQRFFEPAWVQGFQVRPEALEFFQTLGQVGRDGLKPDHYHLQAIQGLLQDLARGSSGPAELADLELLLTDAFLVLASHYWNGRINPEDIDPEWQALRNGFNPIPILDQALENGDVKGALRGLLPVAPEYSGLREALGHFRKVAAQGGWPTIPEGPKLTPGDRSSRVPLLRRHLEMSGDYLPGDVHDQEGYDSSLVEAVKEFQERHGLSPDGVVGKGTLAALNVSAAERVRQIEVNLERWRWLPRDLGERYILVNIAAFHLYLVDEGRQVLEMRVVVGKPYRRTPVFSGWMTYLVLNPYWNVPRIIAVEDYIPQMRKNPDYLPRLGIRIYQGWGAEAQEVDPQAVNWRAASKNNFPYNLRQEPGDLNALGRIKFMFPNAHDVYLHDTPARELFLKESRTFSSGCIRLERPLDLAAYLLKGGPFGTREALENALQKDKTKSIKLPRAFPVHLLYWTAWVDREGTLHFRPDIYDRDRLLDQALSLEPPKP